MLVAEATLVVRRFRRVDLVTGFCKCLRGGPRAPSAAAPLATLRKGRFRLRAHMAQQGGRAEEELRSVACQCEGLLAC